MDISQVPITPHKILLLYVYKNRSSSCNQPENRNAGTLDLTFPLQFLLPWKQMEFGMPTAQPTILHGIHHTNPQKVLLFLIVKGNVDKTFQFATGVTSTDWFVTWNCLDYIIVGRSAAACVCSHCHISPLTNAVSKTSPCFLCFLFSLSLAFSSESVSKTCRIWCSFFFLSQVRNTGLSMCIYIMQLVLVLYCQSSYNVFNSLPLLIISFLQISRVHLKKVKRSHLVFCHLN